MFARTPLCGPLRVFHFFASEPRTIRQIFVDLLSFSNQQSSQSWLRKPSNHPPRSNLDNPRLPKRALLLPLLRDLTLPTMKKFKVFLRGLHLPPEQLLRLIQEQLHRLAPERTLRARTETSPAIPINRAPLLPTLSPRDRARYFTLLTRRYTKLTLLARYFHRLMTRLRTMMTYNTWGRRPRKLSTLATRLLNLLQELRTQPEILLAPQPKFLRCTPRHRKVLQILNVFRRALAKRQ